MDTIFLNNRDVTVTGTRFIVGNQTFAMRNITSVEVVKLPARRFLPILLLLAGVSPVAAFHYGSNGWEIFSAQHGSTLSAGQWSNIGIAVALVGFVWLLSRSPTYVILLRTSGGEARVLESTDRKFIEAVLAALNQSIISHA